ncbi:hypothetical protein [Methanobrevibacter sp. V74]|uniref:hypothetical protein n=1 Tax=Methanobrevibacter sp. V74 TaxID=3064279 RepID=UPI002735F850|nr:hypothetical protein [Methanobrevibacter sp. V74]
MSKSYTNDFQRSESVGWLVHNKTVWNLEDIEAIQEAFINKNQIVLPVSRVFTFNGTGYRFDALIVNRYHRQDIEEYLFTQRIEYYVQAEGRGDVALIMINQTSADEILKNISILKRGD